MLGGTIMLRASDLWGDVVGVGTPISWGFGWCGAALVLRMPRLLPSKWCPVYGFCVVLTSDRQCRHFRGLIYGEGFALWVWVCLGAFHGSQEVLGLLLVWLVSAPRRPPAAPRWCC